MTNSTNMNFASEIKDSILLRSDIIKDNHEYFINSIESISSILVESIKNSNTIFFCGNGGSAAEAQHMAAEYCATLDHHKPRDGMRAISLATDTSFITAWSNDFGYEGIFLRQLQTLAKPGDTLFAYSTSGNSINVCLAAEYAMKNDIKVISMTGNHEDMKLEKISTFNFKSPSNLTPNIQEIHTIIGHEVCRLVEKKLFNI